MKKKIAIRDGFLENAPDLMEDLEITKDMLTQWGGQWGVSKPQMKKVVKRLVQLCQNKRDSIASRACECLMLAVQLARSEQAKTP